jgi:hypothetical protein
MIKRLGKATGTGLRHFFGARTTLAQVKDLNKRRKDADNIVTKAKILSVMGLYGLYKGSPIGLAMNVRDSITVGKWRYSDLKDQQQDVDAFLAATGMSDEGVKTVSRLVRNGASDGEMYAHLSAQDAAVLNGLETDLHIEAGHCINFS